MATFGDAKQIWSFLLVLWHPRKPRQVGVDIWHSEIANIFATKLNVYEQGILTKGEVLYS